MDLSTIVVSGSNTALEQMIAPLLLFTLWLNCHGFGQSRALGHADDRKNLSLENNVWDREYSKGDWSYLATNPLERSRMGVIYSSFYQTLANKNHLLDVGCGEGALSDLFVGPNAHYYHGIDVSKVAIEKAKTKRPRFDFAHANAEDYKPVGPVTKFKMIVFSEMIYYIDHKVVLPHYARNYLEPNGTFVVSVWGETEAEIVKSNLYTDLANLFEKRGSVFVSGTTANPVRNEVFKASFLVIAYAAKGNQG